MNMYALVGCIVAGILVVMVTAWALVKDLVRYKTDRFTRLTNGLAAYIIEDYIPAVEKMTKNTIETVVDKTISVTKQLIEEQNK